MKTYIIVVDVKDSEICRGDLEDIEGMGLTNLEALQQSLNSTNFDIYTLSEFMDYCNNEEFIPDEKWIGYVNLEEEV